MMSNLLDVGMHSDAGMFIFHRLQWSHFRLQTIRPSTNKNLGGLMMLELLHSHGIWVVLQKRTSMGDFSWLCQVSNSAAWPVTLRLLGA